MDYNKDKYEINDLKNLIIKSLELYDLNNSKYAKHLNSKVSIKNDSSDIEFLLEDESFKATFQILGFHDFKNNIWIWSWLTQLNSKLTILSRELLNYGLKLDPSEINAEQLYLKALLLNSRYIIDNKVGLDINLSIFSYILKEKILFIYPYKNDETNITFYYVIN